MIETRLDGLQAEFKLKIEKLIERIKKEQLPIYVFETTRTKERQRELVKIGSSKTMKSKHIEGLAVDFVVKINGLWTWDTSYKDVLNIYKRFGELAVEEGLTWGGNWDNFVDMPHVQL